MKATLLAMILSASVAFAHTPPITPGKAKIGDLPPVLEDKPLPPFVTVVQPLPGVFVLWTN